MVLLLLPGLGPHHTANRYPARPCGIRYPKAYAVPSGWIKHLCKVLTKNFKQALHTNHPAIWVSMEPLNWLQDQRKWVVFSEESDYRQTMPPGVPWSVKSFCSLAQQLQRSWQPGVGGVHWATDEWFQAQSKPPLQLLVVIVTCSPRVPRSLYLLWKENARSRW